ncbi:hypothetical protein TVAG_115780 [Trichomonas vaginalis G3]|uniref:F5/8 type C domain-containing protein n=2 Tax=Trichomonas vaginalis (strain ATCC PRA-98 / G3) TaxID=412133 RepID=A2EH51_TRIV3|nr:galactose-binding domain-like family [Trichomonas vaginalis G3]EAY08019.1 hypothetical protein TVAG_115780 [Trichomonas vaginalis G3]KAI5537357.1 galactose-binding domain-like family [Trichomonas vaginalis G3]|eukprot:XP_001320242.1 hypothetical protein [Trichomonas vaginalis G3]
MLTSLFFINSRSRYKPGIISKVYDSHIINIYVSGSSKQNINGSLQLTKPEYSIYPWDKRYDWCSNCYRSYDEHPYITYNLQHKKFKINGYFIRCGCCYNGCCCEGEDFGCPDCCLFSWSLQISDDNKTWTDIHKVERDYDMRYCNEKEYNLDKYYTGRYLRIIQNEACPGNPPCIALNKLEFFGEVLNDDYSQVEEDFVSYHDDDDDVSIIGHISKNNAA